MTIIDVFAYTAKDTTKHYNNLLKNVLYLFDLELEENEKTTIFLSKNKKLLNSKY